MFTIETYVRGVISQFKHILYILNANQILHMNIQNSLLCRRTMLRMLIAVGGYHFCNAVSKHRWIATQAFSSHWWKSCTVKMGWDQKSYVEGGRDTHGHCQLKAQQICDELSYVVVEVNRWSPCRGRSMKAEDLSLLSSAPKTLVAEKRWTTSTGSPLSKSPLDDISAVAKCKFFERFWEKWLKSGTFIYSIII